MNWWRTAGLLVVLWLFIALAVTLMLGVNEDDGPVVFLAIFCGVPVLIAVALGGGLISLLGALSGQQHHHHHHDWW